MATRRKVAVCYQSFAKILMDVLQYVDTSLPIWHHGDFDFFFYPVTTQGTVVKNPM